jgi:FMN phosphatase YigB (HAD superfamily)
MQYNAVLFDYGDTLSGGHGWINQMIQQLYESGYRLGIVSNSNRYGDAYWLRSHIAKKWPGHFEVVIGSGGFLGHQSESGVYMGGSLGCHKPDMRIYERAIHFLNMPPARIMFVGDTFNADVVGPNEAGMTGFLGKSDFDYAPNLWDKLGDKPCQRRNLLTSYSVEYENNHWVIITRLVHLTEPLQKDEEVIAGLRPWQVKVWNVKHDKNDILDTTRNHRKLIRIHVESI